MPIQHTEKPPAASLTPITIATRIHLIRGLRVMLDSDLAELYSVQTKVLNQAVSRNAARFPSDFAFQLTAAEVTHLRSQLVTSSMHGGPRYAPRAFTEQGVAMLSSVLRSRRAIDVNVAIMRAFVHLREMRTSHAKLARRIDELEQKYDGNFTAVFDAIRQLTAPVPAEDRRTRIGFTVDPNASGQSAGTAKGQKDRRVRRR
jgi:ORF6N domain